MRNYPDADRRFEIRRLIDEEEEELEVSEFEKILSQMAFLAELIFSDGLRGERLRLVFRKRVGHVAERGKLPEKSRRWLRKAGPRMRMRSLPRVAFHMWKAWLAQKDLEQASEVRNAFEWDELPEELSIERKRLLGLLEALSEALVEAAKSMPTSAAEARYALGNIHGSPLAVLRAARTLLESAEEELIALERRAWAAYGFGENHQPNKRFDQMSERDIRAYFRWKRNSLDAEFVREFPSKAEKAGEESTPYGTARTSAIKAASKYEGKLVTYERKLKAYESEDAVPMLSYARRLKS